MCLALTSSADIALRSFPTGAHCGIKVTAGCCYNARTTTDGGHFMRFLDNSKPITLLRVALASAPNFVARFLTTSYSISLRVFVLFVFYRSPHALFVVMLSCRPRPFRTGGGLSNPAAPGPCFHAYFFSRPAELPSADGWGWSGKSGWSNYGTGQLFCVLLFSTMNFRRPSDNAPPPTPLRMK